MGLRVVCREQILAPVAADVAEDRVDVVRVVLGVVVFDEEARRFDRVVVALARFIAARPGKGDRIEAIGLEDILGPGRFLRNAIATGGVVMRSA